MSEEEAIAGLKEAFDIDAFSFILRSAFDVLSARDYVKKIYPDIDESKLAGVSVSRSRSNAATERTVKYGLRDKALLKEAPNLPDAMALASFTRNLQNFIVKNRRINHPPPVTIDPIVTLRQSYGSEGKMTTLIISVNADDDTQKALGWFNALSSGLKNWVDTKGEADTAFDPFVVFNEGNEKIGCVIELRQAGYSKASASYRTNIGYLEFKGK
jgi:hypothetical protein